MDHTLSTALEGPRRLARPRASEHVRSRRRFAVASIASTAILVHAVDAWVLQVEGDTSPARRAVLLGLVMAAGTAAVTTAKQISPRWLAAAEFLVGLMTLVTLVPIVGSYIDKQGFGGSLFTGLAAIGGGLILMVLGGVRTIRLTKSRWRKLLALPVSLMILQFFVLPVGLAVYTTQAARPPLPDRTPADVGLDFESVLFEGHDGTQLAAWYVPSHNGAAVIVRHGSGSTRASLIDHAGFLGDAGFGVLLMDARGHGESDGRINELGWHGPKDISAGVDYLERRPDVRARIGILGLSMGGEEAINAAASDPRLAAVVAEGAGMSNYNDSVANGGHVIARLVNWTQYATVDLLSDAPQPPGIEAAMPLLAPRPVLLITGEPRIERVMGPIYAHAGGPTTDLWQLPGTPHTAGLSEHPVAYQERVLTLFREALRID